MSRGTAAAHGCTCETVITDGYPVTINHPDQAALIGEVARNMLGDENFVEMPKPILAAEDWSFVLQKVPGAMAFLGACPEDLDPIKAAPNHSNLMRISESKLHYGVAMYAAMAMARP